MQQILVRIVKGDLAVRIGIWRQELQTEIQEMAVQIQAEETFDLLSHIQTSSVRLMMQCMTRISKGDLAMRVLVWSQKAIHLAKDEAEKKGVDIGVQVDTISEEYRAAAKAQDSRFTKVMSLKVLAALLEIMDVPRLALRVQVTNWRINCLLKGGKEIVSESRAFFGLFATKTYME